MAPSAAFIPDAVANVFKNSLFRKRSSSRSSSKSRSGSAATSRVPSPEPPAGLHVLQRSTRVAARENQISSPVVEESKGSSKAPPEAEAVAPKVPNENNTPDNIYLTTEPAESVQSNAYMKLEAIVEQSHSDLDSHLQQRHNVADSSHVSDLSVSKDSQSSFRGFDTPLAMETNAHISSDIPHDRSSPPVALATLPLETPTSSVVQTVSTEHVTEAADNQEEGIFSTPPTTPVADQVSSAGKVSDGHHLEADRQNLSQRCDAATALGTSIPVVKPGPARNISTSSDITTRPCVSVPVFDPDKADGPHDVQDAQCDTFPEHISPSRLSNLHTCSDVEGGQQDGLSVTSTLPFVSTPAHMLDTRHELSFASFGSSYPHTLEEINVSTSGAPVSKLCNEAPSTTSTVPFAPTVSFDIPRDEVLLLHESEPSTSAAGKTVQLADTSAKVGFTLSAAPLHIGKHTIEPIGIPRPSTYAEATNLALQYPELSDQILRQPLSRSRERTVEVCIESEGKTVIQEDLSSTAHLETKNHVPDILATSADDAQWLHDGEASKSTAHSADKPNWAMAPDEPQRQSRPRGRGRARGRVSKGNRAGRGSRVSQERESAPTRSTAASQPPGQAAVDNLFGPLKAQMAVETLIESMKAQKLSGPQTAPRREHVTDTRTNTKVSAAQSPLAQTSNKVHSDAGSLASRPHAYPFRDQATVLVDPGATRNAGVPIIPSSAAPTVSSAQNSAQHGGLPLDAINQLIAMNSARALYSLNTGNFVPQAQAQEPMQSGGLSQPVIDQLTAITNGLLLHAVNAATPPAVAPDFAPARGPPAQFVDLPAVARAQVSSRPVDVSPPSALPSVATLDQKLPQTQSHLRADGVTLPYSNSNAGIATLASSTSQMLQSSGTPQREVRPIGIAEQMKPSGERKHAPYLDRSPHRQQPRDTTGALPDVLPSLAEAVPVVGARHPVSVSADNLMSVLERRSKLVASLQTPVHAVVQENGQARNVSPVRNVSPRREGIKLAAATLPAQTSSQSIHENFATPQKPSPLAASESSVGGPTPNNTPVEPEPEQPRSRAAWLIDEHGILRRNPDLFPARAPNTTPSHSPSEQAYRLAELARRQRTTSQSQYPYRSSPSSSQKVGENGGARTARNGPYPHPSPGHSSRNSSLSEDQFPSGGTYASMASALFSGTHARKNVTTPSGSSKQGNGLVGGGPDYAYQGLE